MSLTLVGFQYANVHILHILNMFFHRPLNTKMKLLQTFVDPTGRFGFINLLAK